MVRVRCSEVSQLVFCMHITRGLDTRDVCRDAGGATRSGRSDDIGQPSAGPTGRAGPGRGRIPVHCRGMVGGMSLKRSGSPDIQQFEQTVAIGNRRAKTLMQTLRPSGRCQGHDCGWPGVRCTRRISAWIFEAGRRRMGSQKLGTYMRECPTLPPLRINRLPDIFGAWWISPARCSATVSVLR